ncbi:MAG: NAD-dependent epimerase/dehydratase family protein [Polyangiaceae bacterium]|nr:NAD-dependent epimerase/dehydratase family protein [Polyangiaceae bacterium]
MTKEQPEGARESGRAEARRWGAHGERRVGLVGTGYISEYHGRALRLIPGVRLVAVCDRARSRAETFAKDFGVPAVYASLDEMLADANLDAVHVLTPPDAHHAPSARAVDAGVAVLVEKPMATSTADCDALEAIARRRGIPLGVAHNFLFAEPYEKLRADLQANVYGALDYVGITWHRPLGQLTGGPFDAWMLKTPTNILFEIGPHPISMLLDLVGIPDEIGVFPSDDIVLPTGVAFQRRWHIYARRDRTVVDLNLGFGRGFAEHSVHVRGATGGATADLERNTYVRHQHVPRDMDFDRYAMLRNEARQMVVQGKRTLFDYVASKVRPSPRGNPYGYSITRAVESFYASRSEELDRRISAAMGRDVIALCERIRDLTPPVSSPVAVAVPPSPVTATAPAKVLVLGATGFIGKEVVRELLGRGTSTRVLVRSAGKLPRELVAGGLQVVSGDLASPTDLDGALEGVECVVHLARANVKTWADYQKHEIEMTRQVAERAVARGVHRFIYTGTIDSYYAGPGSGTITEATPLDPQIEQRNLYARAKAASETLLVRMHREQALPLVILRPGIVIGRGGSPAHWGVGMWQYDSVCQVWGKGDNKLPLVLVGDVARGILAAIDAPDDIHGDSFNLIGDPILSANEYLDELERQAGVKIQRYHPPILAFYAESMFKWVIKVAVRHPDRIMPTYRDWVSRTQMGRFDCSKAKRVLGWRPESDRARLVEEGIVAALPAW